MIINEESEGTPTPFKIFGEYEYEEDEKSEGEVKGKAS